MTYSGRILKRKILAGDIQEAASFVAEKYRGRYFQFSIDPLGSEVDGGLISGEILRILVRGTIPVAHVKHGDTVPLEI
jgi:hypothetical protein